MIVPQFIPTTRQTLRRALCIGCNYESILGATLKGAEHDAATMVNILVSSGKFEVDNIRLLTTPPRAGSTTFSSIHPTYNNIMTSLDWLVRGLQPGDSIFFYFAGHGSQYSEQGDPGVYQSVMLPNDFSASLPKGFTVHPEWSNSPENHYHYNDPGTGYNLISMLQLNEKFAEIPEGVKLTCMFDCAAASIPGLPGAESHHGPLYREPKKPRPDQAQQRYLGLPPFGLMSSCSMPVASKTKPSLLKANVCMLSGCSPEEACSEYMFEGQRRGLFSFAVTEALKESEVSSNFATLVDSVSTKLTEFRTYLDICQNMMVKSNMPDEIFLL